MRIDRDARKLHGNLRPPLRNMRRRRGLLKFEGYTVGAT
jgi:hypothetical protein